MITGVGMQSHEKPEISIDIYVAQLTPEDKKAMARLLEERTRLKTTWPDLRMQYARLVDELPLFSMSGEFRKDVSRIDTLAQLEQQYGDINKYFANGNGH